MRRAAAPPGGEKKKKFYTLERIRKTMAVKTRK
jgi:hypothetical protein